MATSYGSIFGLYTQPPEDWEHTAKEEPNSPESSDSQNSDSIPMTLQSHTMQHCYHHSVAPMPHYFSREDMFFKNVPASKTDDSLNTLMSMDDTNFVKVPAVDFERIWAAEGNTFFKKTENSKSIERYRRPINSYPLPEIFPKSLNLNHCHVHFGFDPLPLLQPNTEALNTRLSDDIIPCSPPQNISDPANHAASVNRISSPQSTDNGPPLQQKMKRGRTKHSKKYGHILWKFMLELLLKPEHRNVICWTGHRLVFRVVNKDLFAQMWSKAKVRQHNVKISYDSITRAIRAYRPKSNSGKPAIITHSIESNFTYIFNEYFHQEISDEAGLQFNKLLEFAKTHSIDAPV